MTMGHDCHPPQKILAGSMNVLIEKKPAARTGDAIQPHCCGNSCHPTFCAMGSPTVLVNGRPLQRVTSVASCGSVIMTGAMTVLVA